MVWKGGPEADHVVLGGVEFMLLDIYSFQSVGKAQYLGRRAVTIHRKLQRLAWGLALACIAGGSVLAAGDLTTQEPVEIRVNLGDEQNSLRFFPSQLEFETGKLYKLVLHNPSSMTHLFSSDGLARLVFTRKVQLLAADGKPAAVVRGRVREIELLPSGTAEWWFVPVKTAKLKDLKCSLDGHAQAGMVGSIQIK